jgi:hypothetical protein
MALVDYSPANGSSSSSTLILRQRHRDLTPGGAR